MRNHRSRPPYIVRPTTAVLTRGFDPRLSVGSARPAVSEAAGIAFQQLSRNEMNCRSFPWWLRPIGLAFAAAHGAQQPLRNYFHIGFRLHHFSTSQPDPSLQMNRAFGVPKDIVLASLVQSSSQFVFTLPAHVRREFGHAGVFTPPLSELRLSR